MKLSATLTLPMILVLLGALLSAVGAFLATARQNSERIKSAEQRADFELELRRKSDEIADLNRKIAGVVAHDVEDYCYVRPGEPDGSGIAPLFVQKSGEFPLFGVTVAFGDVENSLSLIVEARPNLTPISGPTPETEVVENSEPITITGWSTTVGDLNPSDLTVAAMLDLSRVASAAFDIRIAAHNGEVRERLEMRLTDGEWLYGFRVLRGEGVVREYSDAGFSPSWQAAKALSRTGGS